MNKPKLENDRIFSSFLQYVGTRDEIVIDRLTKNKAKNAQKIHAQVFCVDKRLVKWSPVCVLKEGACLRGRKGEIPCQTARVTYYRNEILQK